MPLETGNTIAELVATNPTQDDLRSEGDGHLRLLKAVLINDVVPRAQAALKSEITLTALGLDQVDNTSDANKPVSTAQATAIGSRATNADKDASGGYPGLTLFKLNLKNALGTFTNFFTNATTAARTWTLPDKDGTVALMDDLVATSIVNTPAGSLVATTVQAAINELDTKTANKGISTTIVTTTAATYAWPDTTSTLYVNYAGTHTVTLPAASSWTGRTIRIKTLSDNPVVSASSDVTPQTGGTAGTAIISGKDGKWVDLQSNGTTWGISAGSTFAAAASYSGIPAFSPLSSAIDAPFTVIGPDGMANGIIGAVRNTRAADTLAYPTGVTGYGRTDNAGNQAFGLFGRADLYNTGVATNEINSFNYAGSASSNLPPDRGIGTTQKHPICLTIGAGGNYSSSIGIHITPEGSEPQKFLTGIYMAYDSCVTTGLHIAAHATAGAATYGAIIEAEASGVNLSLKTKGTAIAANAMLACYDSGDVVKFALKQNGDIYSTGGLSLVSPTSLIGYGVGAGGTVTQETSKSTGVELNAPTGMITMNAAALAAGADVGFTLTNSAAKSACAVILNTNITGVPQNHKYTVDAVCSNGSVLFKVHNHTAGSLSEALKIRYALIQSSNS